jgi:hypothetical protein
MNNKLDNKRVAEELEKWFNANDLTGRYTWTKNPVGVVMKKYLGQIGRWRTRPRGNPHKAYKVLQEKLKPNKEEIEW